MATGRGHHHGADLAPVADLLAARRDEILDRWLEVTGLKGSISLVRRLLGAGGRRPDEKDIELLVLRHQVKVLHGR